MNLENLIIVVTPYDVSHFVKILGTHLFYKEVVSALRWLYVNINCVDTILVLIKLLPKTTTTTLKWNGKLTNKKIFPTLSQNIGYLEDN